MIEFISNILTFPWWVVSKIWIFGFGVLTYYAIFEMLRYYKPWEKIIEWWKIK